jgi:hypothetical protein
MKKLPIDLPLRTVTTKVTVGAWKRAQELKAKVGCRLSDVISAAIYLLDEQQLRAIMDQQAAALAELPKPIQSLLKDLDKLSDEDRKTLRAFLEE